TTSVSRPLPRMCVHVVPRLRQSRRNQGSQPMRELVYGVHVDHVVASMRPRLGRRNRRAYRWTPRWGVGIFLQGGILVHSSMNAASFEIATGDGVWRSERPERVSEPPSMARNSVP